MTIFTVVDVLDTFMAIGHYEYQITVVTHGQPDVQVAAMAYALFAYVVDELGDVPGFHDEVSTACGVMWALALLLALVAVSVWLYRVRGTLRMEKATLGWLGATVLLKVVSAVYDTVAAPPNPSIGGVLATRPVAYSLWMVSTIVLGGSHPACRAHDPADHRCVGAVAEPRRRSRPRLLKSTPDGTDELAHPRSRSAGRRPGGSASQHVLRSIGEAAASASAAERRA